VPIPFNRPTIAGDEFAYMRRAVENGHLAGDGEFTRRCGALLEESLGVPKVLLTTSCTHALEMTALLLDVGPGDEVIIPSFTFVSTVNAFVLRGAKPVFIDIRPDTLNLDERQLEGKITPRCKAVVPVHYAGVACAMDEILALAQRHGIAVVEDNAHGLYARFKGKNLGTFGALATQSFHETKNIICGEGGALLINDTRFTERAEIVREKGTNRSRFFRGQVDKYTWVDTGSSYLPSEILAAFLLAQLEKRDEIQQRRKKVWEYYDARLRGWAEERGVRLPVIPPDCEQSYHMYHILLPTLARRHELIAFLKARRIGSAFHYLPLHLSEMGRKLGGRPGDCPVTEDVSDRLLRLPFFNSITEGELDAVVDGITQYFN
jgi:dTDP-4-amino-4,6-dideoxygalactose transaminase